MKKFIYIMSVLTLTTNTAFAGFKTAEEICSNPEKHKLEIESLSLQIKENIRCKGQLRLGACSAVVAAVGGGIVSAASLRVLKNVAKNASKEIFEDEYRRLAQFFFDRWKDKAETMTLEQVRREITLKKFELKEGFSKELQREIRDLEMAESKAIRNGDDFIRKPQYINQQFADGMAKINLLDIENVDDLPGGVKSLDAAIPEGHPGVNQVLRSAQNVVKDLRDLIKTSGLNAKLTGVLVEHGIFIDPNTGKQMISDRINRAIIDSYDRIAARIRVITNVTVRQMLSGGSSAAHAFNEVAKKRLLQTAAVTTGAGAIGAVVAGVIEPTSGGCSEMTDVYTNREETTFSGCQPRYEFNENVVRFLDMTEEERNGILRSRKPVCEYYVNFRNKMYSDASPSTIECKRDSISATGTWKGLGEEDHHGTFKIKKNAEGKIIGIEFETSRNRNSLSVLNRSLSLEVNPDDGTVIKEHQDGFTSKAIGAAQLFYAQAEACCSGDGASCGDAKVTGAAVGSQTGGAGAR